MGEGNVFATDSIIATLMTAPRSLYSWDIVVERVADKLFFDKRDDSEMDNLTVNETATEPPQEDIEHINSAFNLSREATRISEDFSQQCLRPELQQLSAPNPFAIHGEETASAAYRYRRWALDDNMTLVARYVLVGERFFLLLPSHFFFAFLFFLCSTEHDALIDKDEFATVRALNEWDPKVFDLYA